ncbi:sigma factor-like helix-turn-helix DNA-binding protein [Halobacillus sp. Cin3]|uniref:sigma factor-like helix-turn-helix DNA-binding protein n=1 Tax=Halobacillus sp. Cin3 TaxID=2928441 RepID=UPI00248F1B38|nr:sigma factor-like helix-turn-helix DNA-binding protein [Halobacillus sp. Cin3]
MENWADNLIYEYEMGRKDLSAKKKELNDSVMDCQDKSQINSMMNGMSESIEWMTKGREPGKRRGADKRGIYQRKAMTEMDMFPSLDITPKERELSEVEKQSIYDVLIDLSPRERQCFLLHKVYFLTFAQISEELEIGRSSVQKYVERAKNKISCRASVVQCS